MKIVIANGRVIDPRNRVDAVQDVYVADGRIVAYGRAPAGFKADKALDATGLVVAPGLVDLVARLREPGFEHKATLESEMLAAVAGGVTRLACPPDTDPPLDEPGLVEMLVHRARGLHLARVHPVGALTAKLGGERLTEMVELNESGCVAFSNADVQVADTNVLWRAMQYASTFGFPVWLRAQDGYLSRDGVAHDGEVATRLGLPGIPVFAETIALSALLQLVATTGTRVHVCRLSSAAAVDLIRKAKAEGLPVSCDVGIHHLHLADVDIGYFDSHLRLEPPLRTQRDRAALASALAEGTIDCAVSDHTPVDEDQKQLPFGEAEPGATGLELLLPLLLRWGASRKLDLPRTLACITSDAARILGTQSGRLSLGAPGDVAIFDEKAPFRVTAAALRSQGKNSPFLGYELAGRVRFTLVAGNVVFEQPA